MSSSYPSYPWTPTTSTVLPGGIISGVPTSAVTSTPSNGSSSQNFTASPTGSTPASYPSSSPTFVPNAGPGISVQTVLSTIGLVCLIVATVYTIHVIRRDRRLRRLLERENGGQDLESNSGGGARLTSTYRPEDEDPASPPPPQYRVYGGDQPYIDPEMVVVYPDMVFLNNNSALESVSSQRGLIGTASAMTAGDLNEPITTTTTTTITTTTTTMTCSSPPSTSSMNPVVSGTTITAPSPVITLTAGRYQSIIRHGLPGSNNIHSTGIRSPTLPTAATGVYSTNPSSPSTTELRSASSTLSHPEQSLLSVPAAISQDTAIRPSESQLEGSPMSERVGYRRSGTLQPILNRLRSQGPPPYIPMAPEEIAPQLPPEYVTAVSQ